MLLAIVQSELTDVLKLGNFKWEAILLPHFAAGVDGIATNVSVYVFDVS